jgi:hypothetical protein
MKTDKRGYIDKELFEGQTGIALEDTMFEEVWNASNSSSRSLDSFLFGCRIRVTK